MRTPPPPKIPSYSVTRSSFEVTFDRDNPDFYREVAECAAFQSLFRPVRLVIENTGSTPAEHVRVEIEVYEASGVSLKDYEPDEPARTRMMGVNPDVFRSIRRPGRDPGDVEIFELKKNARLVIECGNMQPGRRVPSDRFYLAVRKSDATSLSGKIFAATLEQLKLFPVTIDATISVSDVSARRFVSSPRNTSAEYPRLHARDLNQHLLRFRIHWAGVFVPDCLPRVRSSRGDGCRRARQVQ